MFCGIQADSLIVRPGVNAAEWALQRSHIKRFNSTGKPEISSKPYRPNKMTNMPTIILFIGCKHILAYASHL
jgi:hypothetical protein